MPVPLPLRLLIPALIGVLVCLRALAYASPPDPTWIGGFWDDDDYDDVIIHIASTFSGAQTVPGYSVQTHWVLVWVVRPDDDSCVSNPVIPRYLPRGPPSPEPSPAA
jgi:hypothetical protein